MPRYNQVVQIFVASPSDVADERSILELVVSELNRTWLSNLNITLEVWKWETHSRPGFDTEPQAVVNRQIPAEYDIFVGLFWTRIGTRTSDFPSGSVEEFEQAFARSKRNGGVPELMVYFKEAPISPSKVDAEQLAAVHHFRASLAARGGLFSTFEDQAGFEASLRSHLSAVAQRFASVKGQPERSIWNRLADDFDDATEQLKAG